jgi:diguanylate cyclase (GGDEF)-like protein/PAS domain S-box-containing protein
MGPDRLEEQRSLPGVSRFRNLGEKRVSVRRPHSARRARGAGRRAFDPIRGLAGCFVFILSSVVAVGFLGKSASGENIIWLANGLLLAYLLIVPKWRWVPYLAVSTAGLILGSFLIHESWRMNFLYNTMNLVEVTSAAVLLRRRSTDLPRFTDSRYVGRYVVFAVVGGPLIASVCMAAFSFFAFQLAPLPVLLRWLGTDCIGIAVTTPVFVAIFQNSLKDAVSRPLHWIYLLLLVVVTITVFGQSWLPLMFVIFPVLLFIQLRMGLGWAAVGAIFVTLVGGSMTARNYGPLTTAVGVVPGMLPLVLQLFLISAAAMMYGVSVVLESERFTERRLSEMVSIHRLIAENSRDVIILSDFDEHPYYVSPAIQGLWGWEPGQLMRMDLLDLVHPEDLARVAAALREMRAGSEGAMVEHRVRKQNGEYTWVEASLRTIRDPVTRVSTGVLQMVRDIGERKRAETQLEAAYHAVEALAVEDALTGLANRRRFDEMLAREWRRGSRDRGPLSLLLLDVDHFKAYNDTYGHVQGDSCLRLIAEVAMDTVMRTGDLVARYGGEEFAIVLPSTHADAAFRIAHQISAALRSRCVPHETTPARIVTISIGCATLIPNLDQSEQTLVELADKALYSAKNAGRNRICMAGAAEEAAG